MGEVLSIGDIATVNGVHVAAGSVGTAYGWDESTAVWVSSSATDWQRVSLPHQGDVIGGGVSAFTTQLVSSTSGIFMIRGLAGDGGDAFVSANGTDWRAADTDFGETTPTELGWAGPNLVAPTHEGGVWASTDGIVWNYTPPSNEVPAGVVNAVPTPDGLLAFDYGPYVNRHDDMRPPVEVWHTADGSSWTRLGPLPGSLAASYSTLSASSNAVGTVAVLLEDIFSNQTKAWYRPHGGDWVELPSAPTGVTRLVQTSFGFVGVGRCLPPGWVADDWYDDVLNGVTWLSANGWNWALVAQPDPYQRALETAIEADGRLVGLGTDWRRYYQDKPAGAIWVAPLPLSDPAAWTTADDAYVAETCGDL